jgi:type I restriction enzyme S subunit
MNSRSSREQVSLSAVGATVFHSSADKIRSTYILVPPVGVQDRIVDELDKQNRLHRSLVNGVNLSIDRLKEYRSALITAAVTGQIDVTTYAKSGTPDRRLDAIQEEMGA